MANIYEKIGALTQAAQDQKGELDEVKEDVKSIKKYGFVLLTLEIAKDGKELYSTLKEIPVAYHPFDHLVAFIHNLFI